MIHHEDVSNIIKDLAAQKEAIIFEQLNGLISRGLLVIEQGEMLLVRSPNEDKVELRQKVRLVSKENEYIEKLEAENSELRVKLDYLADIFYRENK